MEKRKIKIIQFVEAFGGGVYTYVKDLCNFLVQNHDTDCEVHLIYSPNRVEFDSELFHKDIDSRVTLHKLDMHREIVLKEDINIVLKTRKILKKIQPDILHLHSSKASVLGRLASVGLINRSRIFYSPHGYAFMQQNISGKKKYFYKFIEYIMPTLFGGLTIASGNTEFELSKKISRSFLIRNGVDFSLPEKILESRNNKRLVIGTIGRLTPQKNPELFNQIAEKLPDVDFIWIGNGELQHQITSDNISVTGWIRTREELLHKLNEIDVYTQVSLWEGLPIAIIEAMAMRKPLIVTNIVGNRDCVDEGYNGYVFDSVDEAIVRINQFKDKALIEKMGNNSFDKAFREYHKEKNFSDLLDLYLQNLN
ncbi:glycosyltransferase [Epilithonimonas sp.]|uniref:glycosyltransferase n=1 Tax=Epilithonimonas sp. TaxID=2894511 RepID=UPI0035B248A6